MKKIFVKMFVKLFVMKATANNNCDASVLAGRVVSRRSYDTFGNGRAAHNMAVYLRRLPSGLVFNLYLSVFSM